MEENAYLAVKYNTKSISKAEGKVLIIICFLSKCKNIGKAKANEVKGIQVLYIKKRQNSWKKFT